MSDTAILEAETEDTSQVEAEGTKRIQQRIQERAYELFVEGGCEHGRDVEHWLQAETELTNKVEEN